MSKSTLRVLVITDDGHTLYFITRISVTGCFIVVGRTIVKWYLKMQNTVETSTYGSELVALWISTEELTKVRYKLHMMGIELYNVSHVLCDNKSVVWNMQLSSSSLKKKHNYVAYHKCR